MDQTIKEEDEGDIKPHPIPVKHDSISQNQTSSSRRESNSSSNGSGGIDAAHRKGPNPLTAVSEDAELSSFAIHPRYRSSATSTPTPDRRSSWLPLPTDIAAFRARRRSSFASPRSQSVASHDGSHEGPPALHRARRISSTGSLILPNGIGAWKENLPSCPSRLTMSRRLFVHQTL